MTQLLANPMQMPEKPAESPKKGKFKPSSVRDGFDTADEAVQTINNIWREGRSAMYATMQQWLTNLLFFRGKQYLLFADEQSYEWLDGLSTEALPDKIRLQANVLNKHVLAWVARMTRHNPRVQVLPVTADEIDKDRADTINRLIDWRARAQGFRGGFLEAMTLTALFGNSFLKSYYDPDAGPFVSKYGDLREGDLGLMELGMEGGNGRKLSWEDYEPEGDVKFAVVPPYEITTLNSRDRKLEDMAGILHSRIVTLQEVKERYAGHPKLDDVKTGDFGFHEHQLWFTQRLSEGIMGSGAEDRREGDEKPLDSAERVLVHEYWGKACRKRPKGIRVVVAGDVLLEPRDIKQSENPYWHGAVPFVHLRHTPDHVNFWATCDIEQAVPIQAELNRTISQVIEARNRTANPPILNPQNSGVDFDNLLNVPGEVWRPKRGVEVKYVEPPNMPAYVDKLMAVLRFTIEEIFSDHKPSQGVSKAGDSGVKVRALQMADESRFVPFSEGIAQSLKEFHLQQVCLIAQYVKGEKLGYLVGEKGERSYFSWDRARLLGAETPEAKLYKTEDYERARVRALREQLDIEVSIVPGKSIQTVREDMGILVQMGVLDPIGDRQKILDLMGYGFETPMLMQPEREQAAMASMENDIFVETGQLPMPGIYELHAIHIETHAQFTNYDRFRNLPPEQQEQLHAHIVEHEKQALRLPLQQAYVQEDVAMEFMQTRGHLPAAPQGPEEEQPKRQPPVNKGRGPQPAGNRPPGQG